MSASFLLPLLAIVTAGSIGIAAAGGTVTSGLLGQTDMRVFDSEPAADLDREAQVA